MLTMTVTRLPQGAGWVAHVYRGDDPEWIVAAGGQSRNEALARARGNFDRDERILIVPKPPKGK